MMPFDPDRHDALGVGGLAGLVATRAGRAFARPAQAHRPDFGSMMADDMGHADNSFIGSSHVPAAAIDSIAAELKAPWAQCNAGMLTYREIGYTMDV